MIKVGGTEILGHQLRELIACGITDIIITTGPFEDQIKSYVRKNFPKISITYVRNRKYKETNYIYSLWLTHHLINEDVIFMHGDLLFEKSILSNLLKQEVTSIPLAKNLQLPDKDFKARVIDGRIAKIGVDIFGEGAYFCAPIYRISKEHFLLWMRKICEFISNGRVSEYAENALNELSSEIEMHPLYYNGFCMEIDNQEDLKRANNQIYANNRIERKA